MILVFSNLMFLLIISPLVIYGFFIVIGNILFRLTQGSEDLPSYTSELSIEDSITVIIPTYNEESVIYKKIKSVINALKGKFPNWLIIVVDESSDKTVDVIKLMNEERIIIEHSKSRMGYNQAIFSGIKIANENKAQFIILTDSHSYFGEKSIQIGVNFLKRNKSAGAVSGFPEMMGNGITEKFYRCIQAFLRQGESYWDSTIFTAGELSIFKSTALDNLKEDMIDKTVMDIGCAIQTRKNGLKVKYLHPVIFSELIPTNRSMFMKQKSTRALNLAKTLIYYREILFNPHYSFYGLLTYPFLFYMIILFPIFLPFALVILLYDYILLMLILPFYYQMTILALSLIIAVVLRHFFKTLVYIELVLLRNLLLLRNALKTKTDFIDKIDSLRK